MDQTKMGQINTLNSRQQKLQNQTLDPVQTKNVIGGQARNLQ
jgi:hypothetical protein